MPILIIGAGAAGLSAAAQLSRAGHEVVLIEGRDRIGGRIFTVAPSDVHPAANPHSSFGDASNFPIELGAEFVHGRSPHIFRAAAAAKLALCDVSERHWFFEDGKLSSSGEFWRQVEKLMDEMKSSTTDQSFKDFLDLLPDDVDTRRAKEMAVPYVEGFHAADVSRIGIHGLTRANEAADEIDGDRSFRLLGGYGQLMQSLHDEAQRYGGAIYFETIVEEIHWRPGHVEVVCQTKNEKRSFAGSACLITLPLGVLQSNHIQFDPQLPERKRKAIGHLAMGNVLKINMLFEERFWEQFEISDDEQKRSFFDLGFLHFPSAPIPTWWTQLPLRVPLLVGWAGGSQVKPLRDNLLDDAVESLSQIFGSSVIDQLKAHYVHDWRADPFSLGAYSYVPVDGLESQRALAEPVNGTLFFAGEATSVGHIGTVHGAIQTGKRAAGEIQKGFGV